MADVSNSKRQKATFTPSLKNFTTSLGYEGMTIKKKPNSSLSLATLSSGLPSRNKNGLMQI